MTNFFRTTSSEFDNASNKRDGVYIVDENKMKTVTNSTEKDIAEVENIDFEQVNILNILNGIKQSEGGSEGGGLSDYQMADLMSSTWAKGYGFMVYAFADNATNGDRIRTEASAATKVTIENIFDGSTATMAVTGATYHIIYCPEIEKWGIFTASRIYTCDTASSALADWSVRTSTEIPNYTINAAYAGVWISEIKKCFISSGSTFRLFSSSDLDVWTQLEIPAEVTYINDIVYFPKNKKLYGIGGHQSYTNMISGDDGETWTACDFLSNVICMTYDKWRNCLFGLFYVTSTQLSLMRSDDGETWTMIQEKISRQTSGSVQIVVCPDYDYMLVMAGRTLFRSLDGGVNLEQTPSLTGSTSYDRLSLLAYDFIDKRYILNGQHRVTISGSSQDQLVMCSTPYLTPTKGG